MCRRTIPVIAALATVTAPLAALGQSFEGVVTTGPVASSSPVPALGMPLLCLLVIVLAAVGAFALRRVAGWQRVGLAFAAMIAIAGVVYATVPDPTISGADCDTVSSHPFEQYLNQAVLTNGCSKSIKIIDIQNNTAQSCYILGTCTIDQMLAPGGTCTLPQWACA